jgi:hypothetical protein
MRFSVIVVVAACSGGSHELAIGPPPPRMTQGLLSGPLCAEGHCKCRDADAPGDGGAGVPTDGRKRFEIRLQSAQELWATVGDAKLYKDPETAEECFYVDLPSGDTPVELRASNQNGVSAAIAIHELGTQTKSWYDTFTFNCGAPGVCSYEELDDQKKKLASYVHRVEDLCGSVKIKGVTWDAQHAPDALHPGDLLVHATLDVYKHVPTQPHGDPSCEHAQWK